MAGANGWDQTHPPAITEGMPGRTVEITAEELADLRGQVQAIGKSQAVIEFDLDGTVLVANGPFLKATGYQLDEIRGKPHRLFVDNDSFNSAE